MEYGLLVDVKKYKCFPTVIGEFKYDRMHGAGIYINSEWITFGRFLKDSPAGQTIRYGCNRRTGYIYPVVKISKRAEYTDMRKVEFGATPESIIYNQNEMINVQSLNKGSYIIQKYSNKSVEATVVPIPFTESFHANTRETKK